ncbi:alpha/beta fold hydrolase [Falsiroseomonas sp. CW058]|uniref:alpha/beta fold hydrolase n=1 Tax=Falsiroseomonas sp. CW058 TaxID=3388664 RepID=UPI003D318798
MVATPRLREVEAGVLRVAFAEYGPPDGWPAVLLHGFPYDIHAYAEVAPRLAAAGARVVVPHLRGFGPTRFLSGMTPRSGQQAVLAQDLLALLDALGIAGAVLGGYDWGGRAACICAALWPGRVRGLVTVNGWNIQDIARSAEPQAPEREWRHWYQYYLHGERGHAGLARNRREFCRLLWRLWSPTWAFDEATFARSAAAFDNPDFVEVVVHSYRHRYALVAGDPAAEVVERELARLPAIGVPTIHLDGADDGVSPPAGAADRGRFGGPYEYRLVPGAGHNLPQEAPESFARAMLDVAGGQARR